LNYGQGEGQVEIEGCEWGFYFDSNQSIGVYLHSGEIELSKVVEFVEKVKGRIFGDNDSAVTVAIVVGDDSGT
jgi:hypothetical protein